MHQDSIKHLDHKYGLVFTALLLGSACVVGYPPVGDDDGVAETEDDDGDPGDGDGDVGDGDGDPGDGDGDPGDGDGDPGDGDGDPGDGDGDPGDGDGDPGDCEPPSEGGTFDFELLVDGAEAGELTLDTACTITATTDEPNPTLTMDCGNSELELSVSSDPGATLPGAVGQTVHVWLHAPHPAPSPTWLRVDFQTDATSLFLIEAPTLAPPEQDPYFPLPWDLAVTGSCGPFDDLCAVRNSESLSVNFEGQQLEVWDGDYGSIEFVNLPIPMLALHLWVDRAYEIVELHPLCDPVSEFFHTYKLLLLSTARPVEGEVCDQGVQDPCMTGLHCCYPCGIPGCEFVCTPEDPETLECPLPPP